MNPFNAFVLLFDTVNPFELDHISAEVAVALKSLLKQDTAKISQLSERKITFALTQAFRSIVSERSFTDFVIQFGYLTPYDLSYLSQTILNCYQDILDHERVDDLDVTTDNTIHALTHAMRKIKVELAKGRIEDAQNSCTETHRQTHTRQPLTGDYKDKGDVVRFAR